MGCKALGTISALSADNPTEAPQCKVHDDLAAATADKEKLRREYHLALQAFERDKRRAHQLQRPQNEAIGREYMQAYDRFQVMEAIVNRLGFKIRDCSHSVCGGCSVLPQSIPENPLGFQGHSSLR